METATPTPPNAAARLAAPVTAEIVDVSEADNVTLAAQTGIKDHVRIEDGCVVAARAGVIGDLEKGSVVSGFPARDHTAEMRAQAAFLRLPEVFERLRKLERKD